MSRIHSDENSATSMPDHSSPEPPDPTGNGHWQLLLENVLIIYDQIIRSDLHPAAPHIAEGGNHGGAFRVTLEGGGNGIHPEAIIDDVLAVLPAPTRHDILADCCGGDFHSAI